MIKKFRSNSVLFFFVTVLGVFRFSSHKKNACGRLLQFSSNSSSGFGCGSSSGSVSGGDRS